MLILNGKCITPNRIGGEFNDRIRAAAQEILEPTIRYEPKKWFSIEERVRITDKRK